MNLDVIQSVCGWLKQSEPVWYVTIINTWGTSPRPIGSILAYNPIIDEVSGSLSGGCIEQDLIDELKHLGSASTPFRKQYGVDETKVGSFKLPCGGRLELVIEYLTVAPECLAHFSEIDAHLQNRTRVVRHLNLHSGKASLSTDNLDLKGKNKLCLDKAGMKHLFGPQYRLLIVGLGDITHHLVELAIMAEFSVVVCDPRKEFVKRSGSLERLSSQQIDLIECLPDDLVRERFSDPYCAIVTLAHDPRVDDLALIAALDSDAFFVGALGSKLTCKSRVERLTSLGTSSDQLAKLHAPIGLSINSKTPPEIAISIAAQLIEKRHLHQS